MKVLICKSAIRFRHIGCTHSPPSLMLYPCRVSLLLYSSLYISFSETDFSPPIVGGYTGSCICITLWNNLCGSFDIQWYVVDSKQINPIEGTLNVIIK